ncbi:MAG: YbhB/YbcL family Raf kinase inhibitor-like protein [Candidatus Pacebacteria bacterium]|jgi:Raf kinase inhibitor-like YbhB/YbcL family protein|nr:YbhB/YbcL family Raf kinase inhibitor-like protein [Candidatus Paceibacterota bacterium]MDD3918705.1 YbhB/YbcL family Raf kinase inhibitor-like protein [Candidatus Paceibacterota bacterium]
MIIVKSLAFLNNETIPQKYTCDGKNVNPALQISNIPKEAKSLVLIVDDPDAPKGTWTHWIVFNIDPTIKMIEEDDVPKGGILGINTSSKIGYEGPCPPLGETHRYFFKVYALDIIFSSETRGSNKKQIEKAMENHVIDKGELVGLYSRA